MLSNRPPLPSTGVALGAGVMVSVAAIGLAMMTEINCRHVLATAASHSSRPAASRRGLRVRACDDGTLPAMPKRATKTGDERTSLTGTHDVLICGASFAGLAVARELAGSGADVLIVDRYEIGELQTSACGIPTGWLEKLGLMEAERQRFDTLVIHTPHGDSRYRLPWTFSPFAYRELCKLLFEGCDARFETAKVEGLVNGAANGSDAVGVETDRGTITSPLVADALGWRRG